MTPRRTPTPDAAALEALRHIEVGGAHRLFACTDCRGTHLAVPTFLGAHAMTWPTVLCATSGCDGHGHEMILFKSPFQREAA